MATNKCGGYALTGILRGCKDSIGGIKRVWVFPFEYNMATADASTNQITAITVDKANISEYEFRKNTASLTTTYNTDDAAGTSSFTSDLSLQFTKLENAKRSAIMAICLQDVGCVCEDQNGNYILLGFDNPVTSSAAGANSGTAAADFSGYTITLQDLSKELPRFIDKTLWDGKLA